MLIAGRERRIVVNTLMADILLEETGVDLFDTREKSQTLALKEDPRLAARVLYVMCRQDGETDQQFFTAITGAEIFDGVQALWGALRDFFPSPKKEIYGQAIEIGQKADLMAAGVLANGRITSGVDKALSQVAEEFLARFDELSINLRDSPGSTP